MTGERSSRRSILITGASRGLGLQAAKVLAQRGHRVMATARSESALAAMRDNIMRAAPQAELNTAALDMASFRSIRGFAESAVAQAASFHVILHNAGVIFAAPQRQLTEDGIEETLAVHAVGPLLLSQLLLPRLARPSRLLFTGSELHRPGRRMGPEVDFRFGDENMTAHYHPGRAYKNSKLAQIWVAREWQHRYGADGIGADVICPGFVPVTAGERSTGFQRFVLKRIMPLMPFATSLEHGAQILVQWCERPLDGPGHYFSGKAITEPSGDARNAALAAQFHQWAERAIANRS